MGSAPIPPFHALRRSHDAGSEILGGARRLGCFRRFSVESGYSSRRFALSASRYLPVAVEDGENCDRINKRSSLPPDQEAAPENGSGRTAETADPGH
jgi:hypothetical protein